MPTKPKRPCSKPGCSNLTSGQFCAVHQVDANKQRADANKHYDQHQRNQKARMFYKSRAWHTARQRVLARDNHICQVCWQQCHKATLADTVHHRVPISEDWNRRLDMTNLISLCAGCHNQIHARGRAGLKT